MNVKFVCMTAVLLLCLSLSSGCASIMCGGEKTITIKSEPKGADFVIKDRKGEEIAHGLTPTTVTLRRGSGWFRSGEYTITLQKAGFQPSTFPIKQDLEGGWYILGNIIFGGLIGIVIVDPLTGAMYNISDVDTSLQPESISLLMQDGPRLEKTHEAFRGFQYPIIN